MNPLLLTDGYKTGHHKQYPEGTTLVYSNFTPRSNKYAPKGCDHVVSFGMQAVFKFIDQIFVNDFFKKPKDEVCGEMKRELSLYLNTDYDVSHFEALHDLGYLPICVKTIEEGSLIPIKVPVLTIYNTHPDFFWVTNYLETLISNLLWKPLTSATIAFQYKKLLTEWALKTDKDNVGFVDFQAHDFSMRGLSGIDCAVFSGLGHLTSFKGTDSLPAIWGARQFYGCNSDEFVAGSVNATEHSVMCSGGKESELDTYRRLLKVYPNGVLSVVSDTWDLWKVITEHLHVIKEEIMGRDGKVVIRPDCYDEETMILTDSGWKFFKNLTEEDLVAEVMIDGSYRFVKPFKIVEYEYSGDMVSYNDSHGKIDILVTPDHRMIFNENGCWKVELAKDSIPGCWTKHFVRSAHSKNKNNLLSDIERIKIAFQADGSFHSKGGGIRFSFSKKRKIDRLKVLLENLKLDYKIYSLADKRFEFNIKVDETIFSKDFSWVNTGDLCSNWCKEFIDELSHWDSCIRNEGRIKFDTTNKSVIDIVELIAISAGFGCLISKYEDDRKPHFNDVYTANILKNNHAGAKSIKKSHVKYNGKVYCVQVSSGMLLVKRNRGAVVCGNSGNPADIICGSTVYFHKNFEDAESDFEDRIQDMQIHGEHGDSEYSCIVRVSGKIYKLNAEVEFNRYDKQYYYIDEFNFCHEEYELESSDKGVIELLWEIFGGAVNEQGYRVLNSHIGAIYGDSITLEVAEDICKRLEAKGFASTNIIFGIGSFTYQMNTRDTFGFAMKSTYVEINGEGHNIFKDPITDDGMKKSSTGLLKVKNKFNQLILYPESNWGQEKTGVLKEIYRDGNFSNQTTLENIRLKLKDQL